MQYNLSYLNKYSEERYLGYCRIYYADHHRFFLQSSCVCIINGPSLRGETNTVYKTMTIEYKTVQPNCPLILNFKKINRKSFLYRVYINICANQTRNSHREKGKKIFKITSPIIEIGSLEF